MTRFSSGWVQLLKHLKTNDSLRVLDVGATSSTNINYLTGLGHSVYMSDFVEEAQRPEWTLTAADGVKTFDVEGFTERNLDFAGRRFNVVLFWDTADFLPPVLVTPLVKRLQQVMDPGGQLLAMFHAKSEERQSWVTRYHLTESDQLALQRLSMHEVTHVWTTREIEVLFKQFAASKFFLAKDALREVLVTR